jgi:adenine-specific DNA-methyltransferase
VIAFAKDFSKISALFGSEAGSSGDPSLTKKSMPKGTLEFPKNTVEFGIPDGNYEKGVFESGYELLDDVNVVNGLNWESFRLSGNMIWGQQYLMEQLKAGTKIIVKSRTFVPYSRKAQPGILAPTTIIPKEKATDGLRGRAELIEACGGPVFDHPKPKGLIKYLIEMIFHDCDEGIVLDFFAGSCATGGAVLESNTQSRKLNFILCNIPERTIQGSAAKNLGFDTIPEIGRARLKFEIEKNSEAIEGFKVFRVDESNMEDVYYRPQNLTQRNMDLFASNIKADRTSEDLLTQVLLDWGLPLTLKTEKATLAGKEVFKVAGDSLYASFDDELGEAFAKAVAEEKPLRLVVKDSAFASDTAKVNVQQLLKQLSPNTDLKVL